MSTSSGAHGLRVFADPIYRAPWGTPPAAIEECRILLARHGLEPISICETQFFLVSNAEGPRRRKIFTLAAASCSIVGVGVVGGLWRRELSERLRSRLHGSMDAFRRSVVTVEMV